MERDLRKEVPFLLPYSTIIGGVYAMAKELAMDKETFDYVAERAKTLSTAMSSKQETKEAAAAWLEAVKADDSEAAVDEATEQLLEFLEGRPTTIDGVIAFAQGPAKEMFGEDAAAAMLDRQTKRKQEGYQYCDCDACGAASELLAKFGRTELQR